MSEPKMAIVTCANRLMHMPPSRSREARMSIDLALISKGTCIVNSPPPSSSSHHIRRDISYRSRIWDRPITCAPIPWPPHPNNMTTDRWRLNHKQSLTRILLDTHNIHTHNAAHQTQDPILQHASGSKVPIHATTSTSTRRLRINRMIVQNQVVQH